MPNADAASTGTCRQRRGPSPLTAVALLVVAAAFLLRPAIADYFSGVDQRLVERVAAVNDIVNNEFFKQPDARAMRDGAIRGMLEALGDQYTEYVPPRSVEEFQKRVSGNYVGIGAEVRPEEGFLSIVSPMDDSPALKAGLQAGDTVVAVNGRSVYRLGTDAIINLLQGEPGSTVDVTVEREADERPASAQPPSVPGSVELTPETHTRPPGPADPDAKPQVFLAGPVTAPGPKPDHVRFDLTVTRQRIEAETVRGLHRDADRWRYMVDPGTGVAYVRVSQFTGETIRSFPAALKTIEQRGAKGLVLDLRFNAGGSLHAAVALADMLLSDGTIVTTRGRAVPDQAFTATETTLLPDIPVAVLLNQGSASASEVLAGALKDNDRAIVVGERSVGKGLVQSLYDLPSGAGQLKLTTARYYLPSGRNINRDPDDTVWGVDPTEGFYVPIPPEEAIDALVRRRNEEVLRPDADAEPSLWEHAERIRARLEDRQLNAAVDAINGKLATGRWQPTGRTVTEDALGLGDLAALRAQQERLIRELGRVGERIGDLSTIAGADNVEASDLLPDDATLTGGTLLVRDADGEVVVELDITGEGLERWLMDAPLATREPDADTPASDGDAPSP